MSSPTVDHVGRDDDGGVLGGEGFVRGGVSGEGWGIVIPESTDPDDGGVSRKRGER